MSKAKHMPPAAGRGRDMAVPVKPGMEQVAKKLTRKAWRALRDSNVPSSQVARAAGVNRMTVARFRSEPKPREDMSLKLFLACIGESGGKPDTVIAAALAGKGVE